MRKLIAIVVLLCGAASVYAAEPQKWCSNGFDKPALLSQEGHELLLTIGGTTEVVDIESAEIRNATLMASSGIEDYPQQDIWIVRDRVFFPCP